MGHEYGFMSILLVHLYSPLSAVTIQGGKHAREYERVGGSVHPWNGIGVSDGHRV